MIEISPIGIAHTCFKEKFAIPRQSGLTPHAKGYIILKDRFKQDEALRGLDEFSHMIITFIPHKNPPLKKLTVRPPRLGGNKRLGVFATKSPFRPNPICYSIVQLDKIDKNLIIYFSNHDLLDQTPIIDIKPYIPQWDSFPDANGGWIESYQETSCKISWSQHFDLSLNEQQLIEEVLSLNPAPRYQSNKKDYAFSIAGVEVKFSYQSSTEILITDIIPA